MGRGLGRTRSTARSRGIVQSNGTARTAAASAAMVFTALAVSSCGVWSATAPIEPTPTAAVTSETVLAGWAPGAAPCGEQAGTATDSPDYTVDGEVEVGTIDRTTAQLTPDPTGSTVWAFASVLPQGHGSSANLTYDQVLIVADDGTVVFWNDPARAEPGFTATRDSHFTMPSGILFDAVDCRTGRSLVGTFHVLVRNGPEATWLTPITFGDSTAVTQPAAPATCGQPVSPEVLAAVRSPDLAVGLDPALALDALPRDGVRSTVSLTVTGTGPAGPAGAADAGSWLGLTPLAVHAFLVDGSGTVVTVDTPHVGGTYDAAKTFELTTGDSVPAPLDQAFSTCPADGSAAPAAGDYDLYVYDTVIAGNSLTTDVPLLIGGGPYRVTLGRQ